MAYRTKWTLARPTLAHLFRICDAMRTDELEQWHALVDPEPFDVEDAVTRLYQQPGVKFTLLGPQGEPLVAGGYIPIGMGNLRSWMVGTQAAWDAHWRSITEGTRFVMDCLLEDGNKRLETYALASRTLTGKWYERGLGLEKEGVLRGYGHHGEDVAVYAKVMQKEAKLSDWFQVAEEAST